jgi:2'-5' RNA ligase
MRLFAAIDLTDSARAAIAAEQSAIVESLGDAVRGLKIVRPEHLHLTLAFVGDASDGVALAIIEHMRHAVEREPFTIAFGGVGTFPPRGAPRILWLGMIEGRDEAVALQSLTADRFRSAGAALDSRLFQPHLTLGRWRERARPLNLQRLNRPQRVAAVEVGEIALYQSRLSSSGPTYTRLAAARLRGSA